MVPARFKTLKKAVEEKLHTPGEESMTFSTKLGDYGKKLFNGSNADETDKIGNSQEQRDQVCPHPVFVGYPGLLSLPQFHQRIPSTVIQHAVVCDKAWPPS